MNASSVERQALKVIQNLDLKKYMGRWYEIAKVPSRFQPSNGTDTRATYKLQDDGVTVSVSNETFIKGSRTGIEGKAWKNDPSDPDAKFTVQFWVPPFLPVYPVQGNYWVLDVGKDYEYAVVGEPDPKDS
ncbi:calycin super protein [Cymbomonas tetramitiformis]|uniref:Calycin super protein n=1 Tax=Cymbomonas tetramitiformis TaxID=36881 RepID=A0AAE0GWA7_9CHLO|nr:calycin super protein [Cymbomonas tetramitiformis]